MISYDGSVVSFESWATDLVSGVAGGRNVYVRNLDSGVTVSAGPGSDSRMSRDGDFVVYWNSGRVYRFEVASGVLSGPQPGVGGVPNWTLGRPDISADGRWMVFSSSERIPPVEPGQTNTYFSRVHLYDFQTNSATVISGVEGGYDPYISDNGRFVVYTFSQSTDCCGVEYSKIVAFDTVMQESFIVREFFRSATGPHDFLLEFELSGDSIVSFSRSAWSGPSLWGSPQDVFVGAFDLLTGRVLQEQMVGVYNPFGGVGPELGSFYTSNGNGHITSADGQHLLYSYGGCGGCSYYNMDYEGYTYPPFPDPPFYFRSISLSSGELGPVTTSSGVAPTFGDVSNAGLALDGVGAHLAFVTEEAPIGNDTNGFDDIYVASLNLDSPPPTCAGLPATIVDSGVIMGSAANDVIVGSVGPDVITGGFGSDTICGGEGDDTISGGPSDFGVYRTEDPLGATEIFYRIYFDGGSDTIVPGGGDDIAYGDQASPFDPDFEVRGPDIDTVGYDDATAGVTVDLAAGTASGSGSDVLVGFDNVRGSEHDDVLLGNDNANELVGFTGNDYLDGRGGDDLLRSGLDDDTLIGGTGDDDLRGVDGNDVLSGMAGNDKLNGGLNTADGSPGDDLCVQGSGTGTPVNCERTVMPITPLDVSFTEPLTGQAVANVVVSIPAPTDAAIKFTAKTTNGTALSGSDYVALAAKVFTIPAGATSVQVPVTVKGDALDEPNETFNLVLSSPVGATLSKTTAVATIIDTDDPPGFSVADATVVEGNGTKTVLAAVTLPAALKTSASVKLATTPTGTATAADYVAKAPTTVTFLAGQVRKTVAITIKGDTVIEPNETFGLVLSNPVGAAIADGTGVVTIVDDDTTPVLSVQPVATIEGNSGTRLATFTLRLDRPSGKTVSVKYQTVNGTATAGTDYTAKALTIVSFTPGQTTKTVTVTIRGDLVKEPNETYTLQLSAPVNVTLAATQVTGTITNDD
jgi:Ca2+-binding RTX toxin-like protein